MYQRGDNVQHMKLMFNFCRKTCKQGSHKLITKNSGFPGLLLVSSRTCLYNVGHLRHF